MSRVPYVGPIDGFHAAPASVSKKVGKVLPKALIDTVYSTARCQAKQVSPAGTGRSPGRRRCTESRKSPALSIRPKRDTSLRRAERKPVAQQAVGHVRAGDHKMQVVQRSP